MTPRHTGAFHIGGQRFHITEGNGAVYVTSIHPYDDAEYHYAIRKQGTSSWGIYLNGKLQRRVEGRDGSEIAPQQIARWLLKADREANIQPVRATW